MFHFPAGAWGIAPISLERSESDLIFIFFSSKPIWTQAYAIVGL